MMNDVSFRGHIPLHEDGMMVISSTKHGGEVAAGSWGGLNLWMRKCENIEMVSTKSLKSTLLKEEFTRKKKTLICITLAGARCLKK